MKTTLATTLVRKKALAELLRQAADYAPGNWGIEDPDGNLIFGNTPAAPAHEQPIRVENEIVGRLKSDRAEARFIAAMLENWLQQEASKHQLGAETLHLYREINLIFSFSEKLAAALDASAIANLTLQEAGQIIRFTSGGVFFCAPDSSKADLLAQSDYRFSAAIPLLFFQKIVKNGKSEIIAAPTGPGEMLLCAALKIGPRNLGSIVLRGENFAAADLKLLSTLAVQAATALENSVQHELATAQALKAQREKLTLELAMKNPFFQKIMAVVQEKFTDPEFSVALLAEELHLSVSQLQRKIATMTDITPVQIIRDLRLARSKDLLRTTDLSVAEIAFKAGFNDPSYFTRLFVREHGGTPSEWKEAQMKDGLRAVQENKIMKMYVDESVLQFMGERDEADALEANETVEATVVFVDICGFTAISEQEPPDVVVRLLNLYFDIIVQSIIAAGGTVDKFMGDAVLAVFKNNDHLPRAVETALAINRALEKAGESQTERQVFLPKVSIGLNTGEVIAGNVGSATLRRFDFTVIGDVVNTAQRLQSVAKPGQILLNEATFEQLGGRYASREIGEFSLKNKVRAVRVFELIA